MDDTPSLQNRIAALESRLAGEQRTTDRLRGFPALYAALSVAAVMLPWFPAYGPVARESSTYVHEPLILAPMGYGGLVFLMVAALVALMMTATFARLKAVGVPIAAAVIAGLGAILLLAKFGAVGEPELTSAGCAMVTVLALVAVVGIAHAITLGSLPKRPANQGPPA